MRAWSLTQRRSFRLGVLRADWHLHPGCTLGLPPPGWLYEGHVAEEVLEEMLAEANVTIVRGLGGLVSATKRPGSPTTLATITAEGGANLFRKILDRRLLRGRSCYGCRCRDGLGTRGEHNLR